MFNSLSDRLTATFKNLRGKGRLTESDINSTIRDIRLALIDADVATPVVREFSLRAIDGSLPGFSCGSHVQVVLPIEGRTLRNAYSLLGDPREKATGVGALASLEQQQEVDGAVSRLVALTHS
mgnify:CR=1 FL=1